MTCSCAPFKEYKQVHEQVCSREQTSSPSGLDGDFLPH